MIPSLTVQPIVENAVKHGVHKLKTGGTITISTEEKKECYEISVSDDGIGLENVQERLWGICRGTISIESEINKGTTVIIKIPKGDS